jgi:hypothetical protein
MTLAAIGATPRGGVCRIALTDLDRQGRELFATWAAELGCTLRRDAIGNLFARRAGADDSLPAVATGSHIDTQPTGGKFDGNYGVLAGLEVLHTLNDHGVRTRAPLEVCVWTNEEGSRFVPVMMGSGVYAGAFTLAHALAATDASQVQRLDTGAATLGWSNAPGGVAIAGGAGGGKAGPVAGAPGGPTYRMLANAQNARAARLGKLWARATVSIDYRDSEGRKRWEQGEGHFQVIQPSKLALSVGKLGEVFLWIGCDEERYWLIDTKGAKAAYVGRHELVTRGKIEALGLPVPPRDLIALAGMSPVAGTAFSFSSNLAAHRWSVGRWTLHDPLAASARIEEASASLSSSTRLDPTFMP